MPNNVPNTALITLLNNARPGQGPTAGASFVYATLYTITLFDGSTTLRFTDANFDVIFAGPFSNTFTTPGSGSFTVPAGITSITVEAWGAGAAGGGSGTVAFGGYGGGYSRRTLAVTPGQTIFYHVGAGFAGTINAGTAGEDSWVNAIANSPPVAPNGAIGGGGTNAAAGTGTIGTTNFTGGTATIGSGIGGPGAGGGGGGGAGSAGNGGNAAASTANEPTLGGSGGAPDGGAGGNGMNVNGTSGTQPGGGGGGGWFGIGGAGAAGKVKISSTSPGILFSSKGVQVDQRTSKAQAHWKRGLDVDQWVVVIAPRNVEPVTGAAFPDTILGQPWIAASRVGALDGADVQIDRAYFSAWPVPYTAQIVPAGLMTIFAGRVAEVDTSDTVVVLTINDYRELLGQKMPRNVYLSQCRHTLYDTGCTLNPNSFKVTGFVVQAGSTQGNLIANLATAPPGSGTFTLGKVIMTSGANVGFSRTVRQWSAGTFQLLNPLPFAVVAGDTFDGYAGCDKLLATCNLFANSANFGGEPFIPAAETAV